MTISFRAILLGAFILSTIVSCSKDGKTNVDKGYEERILYIANGDEPQNLDPQTTTGTVEHSFTMNLFEGLVSKHPKTLKPIPGVAERWNISEDGRVYTFFLRKNAKWSNGEPVTANDFILSWQRALMPTLPNEYAYMMYVVINAEAYHTGELEDFSQVGIKAIDDHKLEITLKTPKHYFLQLLDHPPFFPVHIETIKKHGALDDISSRWVQPENFVGNGPFVPSKWVVNSEVRLAKNPHYWGADSVWLNGAVYFPIEDQQSEERAFRTGRVHLTYTPQMDIEKIAHYKETKPDHIRITPTYSSYFYEFNVEREYFKDARVRRAISMAIDRQLIVDKITKGGEKPAFSFVPSDPEGYIPEAHFKYDVDAAKALLSEAGYPNGEGFPKFTLLYNNHDNHKKVALAIQQMLNLNLNLNMEIENKEWKVYIDAKREKYHDIARAGWLADYLDPSNFFNILSSWSGNNDTNWKFEPYDQIIKKMDVALSEEERLNLFKQANKVLAEQMPVIPIYYYSDINLVLPTVQGWYDNPMHYHPLKGVSFSGVQ